MDELTNGRDVGDVDKSPSVLQESLFFIDEELLRLHSLNDQLNNMFVRLQGSHPVEPPQDPTTTAKEPEGLIEELGYKRYQYGQLVDRLTSTVDQLRRII